MKLLFLFCAVILTPLRAADTLNVCRVRDTLHQDSYRIVRVFEPGYILSALRVNETQTIRVDTVWRGEVIVKIIRTRVTVSDTVWQITGNALSRNTEGRLVSAADAVTGWLSGTLEIIQTSADSLPLSFSYGDRWYYAGGRGFYRK